VPRLIINADDLGLASGVNRAIDRASREGVVTSATLMANSRAFKEAVALCKNSPNLRIGCHIVLIDGEPISTGIPSLTDGAGKFKSNVKAFALAAIQKKISPDEIQSEAEAQIRKIQAAGITLTHVDTHKHTHMFPHVLRPLIKAAQACGIRAIRNPFEPFRAWTASVVSKPGLWARAFEVSLLLKFANASRRIIAQEGLSTTDGTVGVITTGRLNQELLVRTIQALPEGTWELVCHPGYADSDLNAVGTRLINSRQIELEALISNQTRQALKQRGVELISYGELSP